MEASKLGGDATKIFIGGKSGGCRTVLATFLTYPGTKPMGGIACYFGTTPL